MLKWVKRIALGLFAVVFAVLLVGVIFEQWSRWSADRKHEPIGQMIAVDGIEMHLHCTGSGTPTVVLESGLDFLGSLSWAAIQPELSRSSRVCSYDRAGIVWSQLRDDGPTAHRIADNLHSLLQSASELSPYVLVGHSLGGVLIRVFADRYPQDVVALVFVDSSHPDQMHRFSPEAKAAMQFPPPLMIRIMAATGTLRFIDLPLPNSTPDHARQIAKDFTPESVLAAMTEFENIDNMLFEAATTGPLDDLPLVVISRGRLSDNLPPSMTEEIAAEISKVWSELQTELTELSSNSEQRVIEDATHYVQLDAPGAVIQAILDVLIAVRERQDIASSGERD